MGECHTEYGIKQNSVAVGVERLLDNIYGYCRNSASTGDLVTIGDLDVESPGHGHWQPNIQGHIYIDEVMRTRTCIVSLVRIPSMKGHHWFRICFSCILVSTQFIFIISNLNVEQALVAMAADILLIAILTKSLLVPIHHLRVVVLHWVLCLALKNI